MFKYIFGISWEHYTNVMFDGNNFLLIFVSLAIFLGIGLLAGGIGGGIISIIIWAIFMKLFGMGGSLIF